MVIRQDVTVGSDELSRSTAGVRAAAGVHGDDTRQDFLGDGRRLARSGLAGRPGQPGLVDDDAADDAADQSGKAKSNPPDPPWPPSSVRCLGRRSTSCRALTPTLTNAVADSTGRTWNRASWTRCRGDRRGRDVEDVGLASLSSMARGCGDGRRTRRSIAWTFWRASVRARCHRDQDRRSEHEPKTSRPPGVHAGSHGSRVGAFSRVTSTGHRAFRTT